MTAYGEQLPLPHNYTDTSREAAASMVTRAPVDRQRVLDTIRWAVNIGATCAELEDLLDLSHQTCSARINGLHRQGLIRDSGNRRLTDSGRKAIVWTAVTEVQG